MKQQHTQGVHPAQFQTLSIAIIILLVITCGIAGIALSKMSAIETKLDALSQNVQILATSKTTAQTPPTQAAQGTRTATVNTTGAPVLGQASAKVTMVVFSDYQCPFCMRFENQTMPQIKKNYIDSGKVKVIFKHYPLTAIHPQAQKAAEAAACAQDQNKFWEMSDALFIKGVAGGVAQFKTYAKDLGLDTAKFDKCLDNSNKAAYVAKDLQDGKNVQVTGTPAFFINGRFINGAQPYDTFKKIIDEELAKK